MGREGGTTTLTFGYPPSEGQGGVPGKHSGLEDWRWYTRWNV